MICEIYEFVTVITNTKAFIFSQNANVDDFMVTITNNNVIYKVPVCRGTSVVLAIM